MKTKFAFVLFFLYLVFQGALRKWWFPGLGTPLLLIQYGLVYFLFLTVPRGLRQLSVHPSFQGLLFLYVAYGFLEIFNMRGTSNMIVQVYGFAMHFSFIPFMYFMGKVIQSEEELDLYLRWLAFITMPLFFLGITQYFSPQDAFINRYATDQEGGTYVVAVGGGGRARITGTFSYLATYASFLCFVLHLLFFATIVSVIKKKLNWYYAVAYGMGVVNLFMTGSRGATLYYGGTEFLGIVLLTFSGQTKFLKNLIPILLLFVVGYTIIQATEAGSTAINDFMLRLFGLGDMEGRLDDSFSPFKFSDMTGSFGYGIGTAQFPMGPYLTERWQMPGYWEEEGERIAIEFGFIGYFIVMALRWTIVLVCFGVYQRIRKLEHKILALTMTMYQLPFLVNLQTNIFNYVDGIFYWIAIGLVYFARILDQQETQKQEQQQAIQTQNH